MQSQRKKNLEKLSCNKQDNIILNALVYPDTPLEKIVEWKGAIKDIMAQFEEME